MGNQYFSRRARHVRGRPRAPVTIISSNPLASSCACATETNPAGASIPSATALARSFFANLGLPFIYSPFGINANQITSCSENLIDLSGIS